VAPVAGQPWAHSTPQPLGPLARHGASERGRHTNSRVDLPWLLWQHHRA